MLMYMLRLINTNMVNSMMLKLIVILTVLHLGEVRIILNADDIACCEELNIDTEDFRKWFDERILLPEYVPIINAFAKCWLNRRNYVSTDGVVNWPEYSKWIHATIFRGLDIDQMDIDDLNKRKAMIAKIIPNCADKAKSLDDDNARILLHNCLAKSVYEIRNLK